MMMFVFDASSFSFVLSFFLSFPLGCERVGRSVSVLSQSSLGVFPSFLCSEPLHDLPVGIFIILSFLDVR